MRVPVSWLGEFVDLPEDVTHEQVHAALVKVGLEEEDVHGFDLTGPLLVGQILEFVDEPQSNGKTIRWCQVDVGEPEPRGIVCGAHNFEVGDKVVVALPGATLPGPFPISARKTYGHVSDGMIASARELALGDEHDGILRLAELGLDPDVGTDAVHLLGLDDFAVEVNVTPDRGYALSIRGIAREYSHSTGVAYKDAALSVAAIGATGFTVKIDDKAPIRSRIGCTVFITRTVRGIDATRPTPPWMIARLKLAGVRSISLPVDITNYVMFELGQPIHGYDLDRLTGGITVRRAAKGEKLVTLDGQTRTLDADDLLITDESGPIGLAGVMGGAATEISATTKDVLIESANFDPTSIARTARRHKLPSEASRRFERGVDPRVAVPAADRVVQLLVELAGGEVGDLGSDLNTAPAPEPIKLAEGFIEGLIGVRYSADEITDSLTMIGATIAATDIGLRVTPPTWRPDLVDAPSLAEEVARIVGYDRIPSVLPVAPPGRGYTRAQRIRRVAAQSLALGGLTEVLSYPFVDALSNETFGRASAVKLANPLDPAVPFLRTSLLPGLLDTAHRNLSRGLTDLALFELGPVFLPESGKTYGSGPLPVGNERPTDAVLADLNAGIPAQPLHIAALFLGDAVTKQPGQVAVPSSIADALAAATQLAEALAVEIETRQGSHSALHPGRTAELFVRGNSVGFAGELLPSIAASRNLPRTVALLELNLDALVRESRTDVAAVPIATLPAATQDLSLVVAKTVPAGDVLAALIEGAGELLEDVRLVDDYRGPGVPDGTKSLTFALRFRAADRTLTAAEATGAKHAAVAVAAKKYGAIARE
jgi:phenylalanyl-tRNA synthetase beta chain